MLVAVLALLAAPNSTVESSDSVALSPSLKQQASAEELQSLMTIFGRGQKSIFNHHIDQVSLGRNVMATRTLDLGDYELLRNISGAKFARYIEPAFRPRAEPAGLHCRDADAQCSQIDVSPQGPEPWSTASSPL